MVDYGNLAQLPERLLMFILVVLSKREKRKDKRVRQAYDITEDQQDSEIVHILHLFDPLMDVLGMKSMVLETTLLLVNDVVELSKCPYLRNRTPLCVPT